MELNQFHDDKELLFSRIKDLDFEDDVSEFKCKRCKNVLLHHYISNCGHAFCANCRKLLGDGSGRWKCPQCQEYIKEIDLQDIEFEAKLFDVRVRCANNKYGCPVTCLLKELGEHLKTCEFTRESALPAPYHPQKTIEAVLEQMFTFNRKFDKINAGIESIEEKMTKIEMNQETFDDKLITLSDRIDAVNSILPGQTNGINKEIIEEKQNLDDQKPENVVTAIDKIESNITNLNKKSDLWLEILEMKDEKMSKVIHQLKEEFEEDIKNLKNMFQDALEAKVEKRNDLKTDNVNPHLKIMEDKIEENKKDLVTLKNVTASTNALETQIKDMESSMELMKPHLHRLESYINIIKLQVQPMMLKDIYSKRQADFVLELTEARAKLKLEQFEMESEWYSLSEWSPFLAQAKLKYECRELRVSVAFKGETGSPMTGSSMTGSAMTSQPSPSLHLIVRNQGEEREWDIVRSANKKFQSRNDSNHYFSGIDKSMLFGFFTRYIKNNTLTLEVHVEPRAFTRHVFSHDGTLTWAIENYRKWKQLAYYDYVKWHESPYFYTGVKGYRVQARVVMNYTNEDVIVYVNFLNGEFDDQLTDSFPHKTTVTFLNQKNPNGHIVKSNVFNQVSLAFQNNEDNKIFMGSFKDVDNVVKNDTLYYHVKIEAI